MQCVAQVENDDYCNRVLAKHWPNVRRYKDVKEVHGAMVHTVGQSTKLEPPHSLEQPSTTPTGTGIRGHDDRKCTTCLPPAELIAGGFPCQPYSVAGKRKGAADDRNLWPEFRRIIEEFRPRYALIENVPGIINLYLDTVLSDLEGLGYTWAAVTVPAAAFDAPHIRERLFIIAHSNNGGRGQLLQHQHRQQQQAPNAGSNGQVQPMGHAHGGRRQEQWQPITIQGRAAWSETQRASRWSPEPAICRVASGIPHRVDRLRALGNAVVPQVAEHIGRLIMTADAQGVTP